MTLKSFGCSFIFGSELRDDGPYATPSNLTWPAHLADHLTCNYECYARPGAGNLQILESVLNQAAVSNSSDLFVIGWTWIDRFDYYPVNPGTPGRSPWRTIMPIDTDKLAQVYYRDLHSEYLDKFTCLSYIKLAVDTLNQKGIKFIMTYMDDLLFDQRWHKHNTLSVIDLQKYVKPFMYTFEDKTFLNWSRANNYPETKAWHPLEEAHRAAANYIINVFDKQNTIDR